MMTIEQVEKELDQALNRLTKWRAILAGWQLGTRADTDPECQAVRDHRELSMLLRAEQSALVWLLVKKGVITRLEWMEALLAEARDMEKDMEERFPGCKATDLGMQLTMPAAAETLKHFPK